LLVGDAVKTGEVRDYGCGCVGRVKVVYDKLEEPRTGSVSEPNDDVGAVVAG
jgi:hypothetical protein